MNVFIGCSSYDDIDNIYFLEAKKISKLFIDKNYNLVFGGSSKGLMGCVYNEFINNDKSVLAIQTKRYESDLDELNCDKLIVSSTLYQLETFMNKSSILMFLPGGYGTYNEIFYMISEYINGTHNKKIIIYNINHYYDGILYSLNKIKEEGFAKLFDFVKIVSSVKEVEDILC